MHDFISQMTAFIGFYEGQLCFDLLIRITIAMLLIIILTPSTRPTNQGHSLRSWFPGAMSVRASRNCALIGYR
jgi:hypothetical protein